MKKIIVSLFIITAFLSSCTFKKATPLPAGCTATMFFATDIKPIIDSKCVTCHFAGGSGTGDFNIYTELKAKVDNGTFKTRVFTLKDMPQAGSPQLTEDELSKLKCWVEQGAPNN